jgi:hypothetical protein
MAAWGCLLKGLPVGGWTGCGVIIGSDCRLFGPEVRVSEVGLEDVWSVGVERGGVSRV